MGDRFLIGGSEARYKIILVGDVNVGKTALFWRFTEGEFLNSKETLVTTIDFKMKDMKINNKQVKLYVWDTAGSEKYRSIVSTYFKGCQGVVVAFDVSRQETFKNATEVWFPLAKAKSPNSVYVLVGNKSDLKRQVQISRVEEWCKKNEIYYIETSVKENQNVHEVFESLARRIYKISNTFERTESTTLNQKNQSTEKKQCCKS